MRSSLFAVDFLDIVAGVVELVDHPGFDQGDHADHQHCVEVGKDEEEKQEDPGDPGPHVLNLDDPLNPLGGGDPPGLDEDGPDLGEVANLKETLDDKDCGEGNQKKLFHIWHSFNNNHRLLYRSFGWLAIPIDLDNNYRTIAN